MDLGRFKVVGLTQRSVRLAHMDLRPEKPSTTYANCYPTHKEEIEDFEKRKKKQFKKIFIKI